MIKPELHVAFIIYWNYNFELVWKIESIANKLKSLAV